MAEPTDQPTIPGLDWSGTRTRQCVFPGCETESSPKAGGGYCLRHYSSIRQRRRALQSNRRRVGLVAIDSHSFRDHPACLIPNGKLRHVRRTLIRKQGNQCALCGGLPSVPGDWHLDHDHDCSHHPTRSMCACCVRGVLCRRCNNTLGHNVDPDWLAAAVRYLRIDLDTLGRLDRLHRVEEFFRGLQSELEERRMARRCVCGHALGTHSEYQSPCPLKYDQPCDRTHRHGCQAAGCACERFDRDRTHRG